MHRSLTVIFIGLITLVFATGCTTRQMKSYLGGDLQQFVLTYGAADNEIDLEDGRRAFQWERLYLHNDQPFIPKHYSGSVSNGRFIENLLASGTTRSYKCIYTIIASWDNSLNDWRLDEVQEPFPNCW